MIKLGDKVYPISKLGEKYNWYSEEFEKAKKFGNNFLYVNDIEGNIYTCSYNKDDDSWGGDYFDKDDLLTQDQYDLYVAKMWVKNSTLTLIDTSFVEIKAETLASLINKGFVNKNLLLQIQVKG